MTRTAPLAPTIAPETAADAAAVEAVVLAAFGPGRFAKTAERLREGSAPFAGFVARDGDRVIGSVRLWPITVAGRRAAFLGPIAVEDAFRETGVGARLVEAAVEAARTAGVDGVLLIGTPWFARFGFVRAPQVAFPGPVDPRRVWWLAIDDAPPPAGRAVIRA